ncbi:MAG: tetratricopeptide repeat protein [Mycobacterium leprae]
MGSFGTFGLIWLFSMLLGSSVGRLVIAVLVLWWLDNRYFGLLDSLVKPLRRAQRIAGLKRSIEINPSDVRSMVELGDHYLHANNPRTAADYLERAISRGEDGARALYLLGGAQVQLGRHDEGRKNLETALAQNAEIAFGEPYLYLLESLFATEGANADRLSELVEALEPFDSVEVLTRAGRICAAAGRKDLARRLLQDAVHNYGYIPRKMRRRARRWLVRARLSLLILG